jgi:hypothetical protein
MSKQPAVTNTPFETTVKLTNNHPASSSATGHMNIKYAVHFSNRINKTCLERMRFQAILRFIPGI